MTKARDLSQTPNASLGFKNRIINGAMMIDQRNAGASVTPGANADVYTVDRWRITTSANTGSKISVQRNGGSVTPPAGFTNYLGITNTSAYTPASTDQLSLRQTIEGFNVSDLAWGTANAQPVTLSFQVRSSLTGTFSGSIYNSAANRIYVFSFTISLANTFETKAITIPGDTTGTWVTDNGAGLTLQFNLGNGSTFLASSTGWGSTYFAGLTGSQSPGASSGATFYITGVQLEKGSTATSFDYRPYGTELQLCQRYYETSESTVYLPATNNYASVPFAVVKRAAPTVTRTGNGSVTGGTAGSTIFGPTTAMFYFTNSSGTVVGGNWNASAEL